MHDQILGTVNGIARIIIGKSPVIAFRTTMCNGKWETQFITHNISLYGYECEQFLNGEISWEKIIYPDDLERVIKETEESIAAGAQHFKLEYRLIKDDGEVIYVVEDATLVWNADATLDYQDSLIWDVSDSRRNQMLLNDVFRRQSAVYDILLGLHELDLNSAFHTILDRSGAYLNASRVILFEDFPDHTGCKAIYEWDNNGISRLMDSGDYILNYEKDIPEIQHALNDKGVSVVNFGDIPSASQAEFEREGIIASAIYAVYLNDERFGFICFDECVEKRKWDDETLFFLANIAQLVSTAVLRMKNAAAIEDSKRTMEAVLNNMPVYIYVQDIVSGSIVFANRTLNNDFGLIAGDDAGAIELHNEIIRGYEASESKSRANNDRPRYIEICHGETKRWFGVEIAIIPWMDGRKMRLITFSDITDEKLHDDYIKQLVLTDNLTNMPNRYQFELDMDEELKYARETDEKGYVIYIDMDDFKIINEGYGHDYGDAMIIDFATFLRASLHEHRLYRVGGDEFAVIVEPQNSAEIKSIIGKLITRAQKPWSPLGKMFYSTISMGVVAYPEANVDTQGIMKNADIAMYEAKKNGKNGYVIYNEGMSNNPIERVEMEALMRDSIARNFDGFQVYYQPLVDIQDDCNVCGAEALLRWVTDSGEMIMPGDFIPLVEYLGLIVPLGEFVLREACNMLKHINETINPEFFVSVNVSVRQLQQQDIVQRIESIVDETGIKAGNLTLEITEGLAISDYGRVWNICTQLQSKGIFIAIDDFGTGYSSLSKLRDMPIDIIKIDRSFIQNIGQEGYAHSFIRLITELGHALGRRICIEGVETEHELEYCIEALVDVVQGYYFYRPMPGDKLLETFDRR